MLTPSLAAITRRRRADSRERRTLTVTFSADPAEIGLAIDPILYDHTFDLGDVNRIDPAERTRPGRRPFKVSHGHHHRPPGPASSGNPFQPCFAASPTQASTRISQTSHLELHTSPPSLFVASSQPSAARQPTGRASPLTASASARPPRTQEEWRTPCRHGPVRRTDRERDASRPSPVDLAVLWGGACQGEKAALRTGG